MCKEARLLERVCHEEMLEMASLGAKVLHTRSVYFAMRYQVPLVVLSTFEGPFVPGVNGTWIVPEEELMEKPIVTGVTYRTDEARIVVEGMSSDIGKLSRLFSELSERGIFIDMISQENVDAASVNVSVTIPDESSVHAMEIFHALASEVGATGVKIDRDIAKVSVVGIGMRYHTGVAARVFEALARERIGVTMVNTSEIKMSVLVPRKYCEVAVRALHDEFSDFSIVTEQES
jgi:aspartate kinase